MKEKTGEVFSIAKDNPSLPGCTISKAIYVGSNDIIYFSLARNTDISAEFYSYHKLMIVADGQLEVYGANDFSRFLNAGECMITFTGVPIGVRTTTGTVYTEVSIKEMTS